MQNMVILGATGSIGTSTLSVASHHPDKYRIFGVVANSSVEKMLEICIKHQPNIAHMVNESAAKTLKALLPSDISTQVTTGPEALLELVTHSDVTTVMAAIVGAAGLVPTMAAVKAGKRILLANKEALVMSGALFIDAAKKFGASILPVDSEHNAIFQCLPENAQKSLGYCDLKANGISQILLTGSGGPFLTVPLDSLINMKPEQACHHPNWSMGPKISVDSATMMNKGLEFIEAKWLFNTGIDELKVVVHPQSMIHSMVQFCDGSVLAQMGNPDMRTPIAHSMAYPERIHSGVEPLDFFKVGQLSFCKPDFERFPCLALAMEACMIGQEATTVLNASNEIAVAAFLQGKIRFTDIAKLNEKSLNFVPKSTLTCIEDILALDEVARIYAREYICFN